MVEGMKKELSESKKEMPVNAVPEPEPEPVTGKRLLIQDQCDRIG